MPLLFVPIWSASAQEPAPDPNAVTVGKVSFTTDEGGTKVLDVDSIRAGGAELRVLHCTGVAGGLLGPMMLGAALGPLAPELGRCAPAGGATKLAWTWAGGAPGGLTATPTSDCVARAFAQAKGAPTWTGACTATVLYGEPAGAAKAAAALP